MKSTALTILFLSVVVFSYGQSKQSFDTLQLGNVDMISQSIVKEPTSNGPAETVPKQDYDLLERKLNYSEFIISSLNTGLTIVAVLFGLLLPLASYVFVIKPQRDLKRTLNNNIEQYLEENRKAALKKAFLSLNPANPEVLRRLAVASIEKNLSTVTQREELLELTHAIELEPNGGIQQNIHHILIYSQHAVTEEFYSQQWRNETASSGEHYANVYFTHFSENAMKHFVSAIKVKNPRFDFFNKLLKLAIEFRNTALVKQLLDNEELAKTVVSEFSPQSAGPQYSVLINMIKTYGMPTAETTNWAFPKALIELSLITDQHRGAHKPSDLRR